MSRLALTSCMASALLGPATSAAALEVAALHYEIEGDRDSKAILAKIEARVDRAAEAGAELLVLPELFALDAWPSQSDDSEAEITKRIASEVTPKLWAGLAAMAKARDIAILGGSAPELREDGLFNTARLFFSDGRVVHQDKQQPTAWGRSVGLAPGRALRPFDAPWGRTVILICYDVEFPSVTAQLVELEPELIIVPSMTESPAGAQRVRWTAQARAVEHHAFVVVAPTRGQPSPGWRHFGEVRFLTPQDGHWPGLLPVRDLGEDLLGARLDFRALRKSRRSTKWFPARDLRGEKAGAAERPASH